MQPVVIEHRQFSQHALRYLAVFGIFAMVFFFSDMLGGYIVGGCAVCGGLFAAAICFQESRKTEIFSEEGIWIKGVLKTRKIPWEKVIQVGSDIDCEGRANEHSALMFTFSGGSPRRKNQLRKHWALENTSATVLSVPYSLELCEMVLRYYGPLDFDLTE